MSLATNRYSNSACSVNHSWSSGALLKFPFVIDAEESINPTLLLLSSAEFPLCTWAFLSDLVSLSKKWEIQEVSWTLVSFFSLTSWCFKWWLKQLIAIPPESYRNDWWCGSRCAAERELGSIVAGQGLLAKFFRYNFHYEIEEWALLDNFWFLNTSVDWKKTIEQLI